MKINKIIISFCFLLLLSCGYEPIYSKKRINQNYNFSISEINFVNINSNNQIIKNNLNNQFKIKDKQTKYVLIIKTEKTRTVSTKDKKGDAATYSLEVFINVKIIHMKKIKDDVNFRETFEYKNKSNKYNLAQYERNLERHLISKLSDDIILYLFSLK